MLKKIIFLALFYSPNSLQSQCTWNELLFDSFEYSTQCSDLIPGMTYQDIPQNYSPHSGNMALYMNIVDGQIGLIYSRTLTNLCPGADYQLSFWTKDAWDQTIDLDFKLLDENNTLVASQNFSVSGFNWNEGVLQFTATSSTYSFQIVTNMAGMGGNDPVVDDIKLERCDPNPITLTNQIFCTNDNPLNLINLIENQTTLSNQGTWSGTSNLANGSLGEFNPQINLSGQYLYSISNNPNCSDSSALINVVINQQPVFSLTEDLIVCSGETVSLNATSTDLNLTYIWNNGITNGVKFQVTNSQTYTVIATDLNNCSNTQIVSVQVLSLPIAQADITILGLEATFTNQSQNATSYEWDFGNGENLTNSSLEDVSTFYENGKEYKVTLIASNGICSSEWTSSIQIEHIIEIQIPNIFTPNEDKTNDLFFITSKGINNLNTSIFNRWGNEIISFDTLDFKWDGKINNEHVSEGTYFIQYNGLDKNNQAISGQTILQISLL
ncbi:MAG: gliding motility-associated C-terminal domain-containing protein [Bacteroidota bacterium]